MPLQQGLVDQRSNRKKASRYIEIMNLSQREAAWRVFREWERDHPTKPSDFAEIMARIDEILAFARRAGTLIEEPPQEKAARLARVRAILARLPLGS